MGSGINHVFKIMPEVQREADEKLFFFLRDKMSFLSKTSFFHSKLFS